MYGGKIAKMGNTLYCSNITLIPNSICIRVRLSNDSWVVDREEYGLILSYQTGICMSLKTPISIYLTQITTGVRITITGILSLILYLLQVFTTN